MKKKIFIVLISFFVFVSCLFFLPRNPFSKETEVFAIEKGEGSKEIAHRLQKEGIIWWAPAFRLYSLVSGNADRLQAGKYFVSPSISIAQIINKFGHGKIAAVKVTVPEGFTAQQIYQNLKDISQADPERLKELEGYLFPDTYLIPYGASNDEIVKIMTDNFNNKVTQEMKEAIANQGKSLEDIVVMASLIEKEVRVKEEKEIVSGIFWKRVKAGVPLQSCASIAYIKGVSQWRYSYEDTQIESPYNTYLHYGLPPGPISNPGLDSILAAIYPKSSSYWYYLSTREGETIFSRNLEEHNIAISKYLK